MRGQRRTVAAVLAKALANRPGAASAALAVAFADACGPRLAREVSCRGVAADGRLVVLVTDAAWAEQVRALEPELLARVAARLGRPAASGIELRVGEG